MKIVSGLANGQVLQRLGAKGATALLTGTCTESGPIHATISKGTVALKGWKKRPVGYGARGKFAVKLAGIPVGGPYRLRLESGKTPAEIASFFVGDVWILAGQSNMEGVGNMTGAAKPHPLVQAFSMRREWRPAKDRLHVLAESPDACHTAIQCSPESGEKMRRDTVKGVGVGLFFAREMVERSGGVPQGLICTAHGGTSMQGWSPDRKKLGGESLYASMLMSVQATGQPVAGLLWYQGESDANATDAAVYTARMKALVAASRRDLHQARLPWIIVQLGRHIESQGHADWNSIQDQQRLLPGRITNLDTVPAVDLSLDDGIHISAEGFPRLAARMASAADRMVYGNKHEARSPQLRQTKAIQLVDSVILDVAYDFVRGGLQAPGEPTGFQLVGPEGKPIHGIYKTELRGSVVRLHLITAPMAGTTLHYGLGRSPYCNITDARGFALPVFGPLPLGKDKHGMLLPFLTQWSKTEVVPATKPLDRVTMDEVKALPTTSKSYPLQPGFINEHDDWMKKSGQCFFHARLTLSEPMTLVFLMGYDGPFRLWVDDKPFFVNMKGTNPCFADESAKLAKLAAGGHEIRIGMDLNESQAWGFFLRVARKDVTAQQVKTGIFAKPVYSV